MNGTIAYALSKQYVASTADSLGSLKGAPCTIKSQIETDDSYIITFEWTGTSGTKETSQLTIKKPKDGISGISITNVTISATNHLICTMSDGSKINAGEITIDSSKLNLDNYYTKNKSDELYIRKDDIEAITSDEIKALFK